MAGKITVITYFALLLAGLHVAQSQEDNEDGQLEPVNHPLNNSNVQPPVTPAINLHPPLTTLPGSAVQSGGEGTPLYCYQCNSGDTKYGLHGPDCDDPNKMGEFLKECPQGDGRTYTRCRKMAQTVEGEYRTIRSCASAGIKHEGDSCVDRTGTINIKVTYCECSNEGLPSGQACNRSAFLMTSQIIKPLLFIATILVWFNFV